MITITVQKGAHEITRNFTDDADLSGVLEDMVETLKETI